jgi:hypothetical protein
MSVQLDAAPFGIKTDNLARPCDTRRDDAGKLFRKVLLEEPEQAARRRIKPGLRADAERGA